MKGRNGSNAYPPGIAERVRAAANDPSKAPVRLSEGEMRAVGHVKKSPTRAIREMCVDCMGGTSLQHAKGEIAGCTSVGCPLWPFRFGRNPFHGSAVAS
jgi:hypothetical protein